MALQQLSSPSIDYVLGETNDGSYLLVPKMSQTDTILLPANIAKELKRTFTLDNIPSVANGDMLNQSTHHKLQDLQIIELQKWVDAKRSAETNSHSQQHKQAISRLDSIIGFMKENNDKLTSELSSILKHRKKSNILPCGKTCDSAQHASMYRSLISNAQLLSMSMFRLRCILERGKIPQSTNHSSSSGDLQEKLQDIILEYTDAASGAAHHLDHLANLSRSGVQQGFKDWHKLSDDYVREQSECTLASAGEDERQDWHAPAYKFALTMCKSGSEEIMKAGLVADSAQSFLPNHLLDCIGIDSPQITLDDRQVVSIPVPPFDANGMDFLTHSLENVFDLQRNMLKKAANEINSANSKLLSQFIEPDSSITPETLDELLQAHTFEKNLDDMRLSMLDWQVNTMAEAVTIQNRLLEQEASRQLHGIPDTEYNRSWSRLCRLRTQIKAINSLRDLQERRIEAANASDAPTKDLNAKEAATMDASSVPYRELKTILASMEKHETSKGIRRPANVAQLKGPLPSTGGENGSPDNHEDDIDNSPLSDPTKQLLAMTSPFSPENDKDILQFQDEVIAKVARGVERFGSAVAEWKKTKDEEDVENARIAYRSGWETLKQMKKASEEYLSGVEKMISPIKLVKGCRGTCSDTKRHSSDIHQILGRASQMQYLSRRFAVASSCCEYEWAEAGDKDPKTFVKDIHSKAVQASEAWSAAALHSLSHRSNSHFDSSQHSEDLKSMIKTYLVKYGHCQTRSGVLKERFAPGFALVKDATMGAKDMKTVFDTSLTERIFTSDGASRALDKHRKMSSSQKVDITNATVFPKLSGDLDIIISLEDAFETLDSSMITVHSHIPKRENKIEARNVDSIIHQFAEGAHFPILRGPLCEWRLDIWDQLKKRINDTGMEESLTTNENGREDQLRNVWLETSRLAAFQRIVQSEIELLEEAEECDPALVPPEERSAVKLISTAKTNKKREELTDTAKKLKKSRTALKKAMKDLNLDTEGELSNDFAELNKHLRQQQEKANEIVSEIPSADDIGDRASQNPRFSGADSETHWRDYHDQRTAEWRQERQRIQRAARALGLERDLIRGTGTHHRITEEPKPKSGVEPVWTLGGWTTPLKDAPSKNKTKKQPGYVLD